MSLQPLLNAPPQIQLHAFAAMTAFVLGLVQFAAPKGTLPHRTIGWIWVLLMFAVSISSFWIHTIRLWGPNVWEFWSPIHLISIFTLVMLVVGVTAARRHVLARHRKTMIWTFCGALVIAGIRSCQGVSCITWCSADLQVPSPESNSNVLKKRRKTAPARADLVGENP
jgi:uncharacterized membrane protein